MSPNTIPGTPEVKIHEQFLGHPDMRLVEIWLAGGGIYIALDIRRGNEWVTICDELYSVGQWQYAEAVDQCQRNVQ